LTEPCATEVDVVTTKATRPFVIVGGGLAAGEAARTLRSEGYDGPLLVVAREPMLPYERPPLTKGYLRGESTADSLLVQPQAAYDDAAVEVRTRVAVVDLDPGERSIRLEDGGRILYERLLLATGARATRPEIEGVDRPWVHFVRTVADADRLREAAGSARSAVVAGGGWIAAETAASLRQMGLDVQLVVPGREVLERHLGAEAARELTSLHERNGVRVIRSSRVAALEQVHGRRVVRLEDGRSLEGDLVVLGVGAAPALELPTRAGLATGDGVLVDSRLRTSAHGVFAAGDVASAWSDRYGERLRTEHWDNARRQARTAARNMLGANETYDRVPSFFSDQFDLGLELVGRPALGSRVLVRHEPAGIVALWTRDGRIVAGMHTNHWDARKPIERLVSSGAFVDPAAVADVSVPLDELGAEPVLAQGDAA
jgi:3-phenylpropionate/trans-cinnamate dioxygenase ferredoxin reductase subunit